jgi:hypothetical protein
VSRVHRSGRLRFAAAWVLGAACLACSRPAAVPDSAALWEIVSRCVDRKTSAYCACPAFTYSCCGDQATPDADIVWARTSAFVAIRNMNMCGCQAGFVAGLVLPRTRVTGVEDPRRPEGIWPFAWEVAQSRIADPGEIGLAINPKDARSQNQMHVHLVRLRPEVRAWLDSSDAPAPAGVLLVPLPTLDGVFGAVEARVGAVQMADTGILVARARAGGWTAVLTHRTSPLAFTMYRCGEGQAPFASRATNSGVPAELSSR